MSERTEPGPARLVISVLQRAGTGGEDPDSVISKLEERFGPADFRSPVLAFDHTGYYEKEMGRDLRRLLVSFERPVGRGDLADIKVFTEGLEQTYADAEGRRAVNLDPGLLSVENFVLATGKTRGHRVYLGKGVYADLTLIFMNGELKALPWTYPDYASDEIRAMLAGLRQRLLEALRKQRAGDRDER